MIQYKRFVAVLLVAVLLLLPLSGCKSEKEKQEQTVIGTCVGTNGFSYDVLYEELRYVTLTYKDIFASTYGEDIWDSPETAELYRAELEATVWDMMLNNYAVLKACANKIANNEDLLKDSAIKKAVDSEIEEAIEAYGGKAKFDQAMEAMYMTENFLRFCVGVAELENELLYVLRDDVSDEMRDEIRFIVAAEDFALWLKDTSQVNYVYVQHVFIRNDRGDDVEANRALANQVRADLMAGAYVDSYIDSNINEDTANVAPYFMVRDVYKQELQDAAFVLEKEGDVSEVVEVENGFYIFVRMEDDHNQLLTAHLLELLNSHQWARVESVVEDCRDEIKIELNEYGQSIDLLAIQ